MTFTATVDVLDYTRWPITALTVMYWQDPDHDGLQNTGYLKYLLPTDAKRAESDSRVANPSRLLMLTQADASGNPSDQESTVQSVSFEEGSHIYWIVAWQNMHDPAIYYLVKQPTIWEDLALDALDKLNQALGDMIDDCTESDIGQVFTTAADHYVRSVYASKSDNMKIENKINTDQGKSVLTITLNADRTTGSLYSPGHSTDCSMRVYLKDSPASTM